MRWFTKRPPQIESARYQVKLHHRSGNILQLNDVSTGLLKFIQSNIGRDEIYVQEKIAINLRDFSMAEITQGEANGR